MPENERTLQRIMELHEQNLLKIQEIVKLSASLNNYEKKRAELLREETLIRNTIAQLMDNQEQNQAYAEQQINKLLQRHEEIESSLKKQEKSYLAINALKKQSSILVREGLEYLMESDKVIKSTILNLGMSGAKAQMMRDSFERSAGYVARLGGTLTDVKSIMEGYADTTGRARALSDETVKSVMAMGKGTGLGVEEATRLAAQFEFMGKDARTTMDYVQTVVDTSERMGVNTTKVLKDVSSNFKKLSTFTFQAGTKAFAQMAVDAERTRVSMDTALNVAEATRGLEKVIELGANLQVMGGEFAKMDPLHWMYTVRNEPEKLNQMISDMTKGLFTLRKTSDGTFERFISPADRDRLTNVARSLGISNEEMFQIAQRSAELSSIQRDLSRLGLSEREKSLVEGAAQFDSGTGKMYVRIGRHMQDITKLTSEQAKAFASERKTLEERAREAMSFDEVWRNTINELKSTLLPILNIINDVLGWVRKHVESLLNKLDKIESKGTKAAIGGGILTTGILTAGGIGKSIVGGWWGHRKRTRRLGGWGGMRETPQIDTGTGAGQTILGKGGKPLNAGAMRAVRTAELTHAQKMADAAKTRGQARSLSGAGHMKTGAGVGVAAAGIGVGVAAGAMGIAELAKVVKDMDVEKLKVMNWTLGILATTMIGFGLAGAFATVGATGLAALGAAALGVGVGIGAAAYGISFLAESFGNMSEKTSGGQLLGIAGGMTSIALATASFMNPFTVGGLTILTGIMGALGIGYLASAKSAESIERMAIAMKGTEKDFLSIERAVAAINSIDKKNINAFAESASRKFGISPNIAEGFAAMATPMFGTEKDFLSIERAVNAINLLNERNVKLLSELTTVGNNASIKSIESLTSMATAMSGTKEDFLAVEKAVNAINRIDRKNSNIFTELANIMKQPLKVEFADSNAVFRSDVTLEIDKTKFMNKIFDARMAVIAQERTRINKA